MIPARRSSAATMWPGPTLLGRAPRGQPWLALIGLLALAGCPRQMTTPRTVRTPVTQEACVNERARTGCFVASVELPGEIERAGCRWTAEGVRCKLTAKLADHAPARRLRVVARSTRITHADEARALAKHHGAFDRDQEEAPFLKPPWPGRETWRGDLTFARDPGEGPPAVLRFIHGPTLAGAGPLNLRVRCHSDAEADRRRVEEVCRSFALEAVDWSAG